ALFNLMGDLNVYTYNVNEVEDLQMTSNTAELELMFNRAKSTVVQGGTVILTRQYAEGRKENFDELTTEADLEVYRQTVFKYL
ncbi:MAG: hypothetical protein ACR2KZ_19710, partial [Segetibacter sp.]